MKIAYFRCNLTNILAFTKPLELSNAARWQSAHQRLFLESWSVFTDVHILWATPQQYVVTQKAVLLQSLLCFWYPCMSYTTIANSDVVFKPQQSISKILWSWKYCFSMLKITNFRGDLKHVVVKTKTLNGNMLLIISAQVCAISIFFQSIYRWGHHESYRYLL